MFGLKDEMGLKMVVCWLTLHFNARVSGSWEVGSYANGSFIGPLSFWVFFPTLIYVNIVSAFGLEAWYLLLQSKVSASSFFGVYS